MSGRHISIGLTDGRKKKEKLERDDRGNYGVLVFALPEESGAFKLAVEGPKWKMLVEELDRKLRSASKYGGQDAMSVEDLRKWLYDEMNEDNLRLYE